MPKKVEFTQEQILEICELSKTEKINDIANQYKVGKSTIRRILNKNNIFYTKRKYFFNENFFNKIDSEDKAYFLGLIYADGNMNLKGYTLSLELQKRDVEILNTFQEKIESNYPLYERDNTIRGKNNWQNTMTLSLCSKVLCNDLIKLNVVPKKSKILKFPLFLSDDLIHHFIRGYFDGDGTVGVNTKTQHLFLSIVGTEDIINNIQKIIIEKTNITNPKILKKGSVYTLNYRSNIMVKKIGEFLYKNATIFLLRKKDKFIHERKNRCKKPVLAKNILTNEILSFESAAEASRVLNVDFSNISACILSKVKTAGGFIWNFKN